MSGIQPPLIPGHFHFPCTGVLLTVGGGFTISQSAARLDVIQHSRSLFSDLSNDSLSSALPARHFLFKTGTGTTPFFGAAAPGYTMATGTVYSTPARPLPRNSLSRGAFKFKKSPKHCSWKCTALIAVGIAVLLSVILCYCIGKAQG